jgi:hypothetical protein
MNREDFLDMIVSREPADRHLTSEVSDLVDLFPYFQSAHLLLLKALKGSNDIRFETQLRHSSIYVADRTQLYYYLAGEELKAEPSYHAEEETKVESPYPAGEELKAESPYFEGEEAKAESPYFAGEQTKVESGEPERDPAVNLDKDNTEDAGVQKGHPIFIQGDTETEELPGIMLIQEELQRDAADEISFLDSDYEPGNDADLLELIAEDELDFEEMTGPPVNVREKSRKEQQSELIDRFIIANPRIEPSREKSDIQPEDLSSASSELQGPFVTDTLARIYIQQGYYSKAIEIYEKLSLKYPEKSSYFAAQIEKVKEYLKK